MICNPCTDDKSFISIAPTADKSVEIIACSNTTTVKSRSIRQTTTGARGGQYHVIELLRSTLHLPETLDREEVLSEERGGAEEGRDEAVLAGTGYLGGRAVLDVIWEGP